MTFVSLFEVSVADAASLAAWSVVTASRVWPVADSAGAWLSLAVVEAVSLATSELATEVVACSETFVVLSVLATFSVVAGVSTTFVSTRSAVVSTLAVVAAVVSRLDALSALASSAKAGLAIKAKLARAVAHENAIRRFVDFCPVKLECTFIIFPPFPKSYYSAILETFKKI